MKPKPHLSISQISMLERCGLQWQFRYVDKLRIPPGVGLIRGKATHKSVEENMRSVMATGNLMQREEAAYVAAHTVIKEWDEAGEVMLTNDEKSRGASTVRGDAMTQATSLALLHYDVVAPLIEPVHVERKWDLELSGFPFDLKGVIDIQEAKQIRDVKTKGKSPSAKEADTSIQLTAYALAMKTLDGIMPDNVQLDALVMTKEPKYVALRSTRTQEDFDRLLLRIEHSAKVIETQAFLPAPEDHWCCSEQFCGYYKDVCPFGARGRARA